MSLEACFIKEMSHMFEVAKVCTTDATFLHVTITIRPERRGSKRASDNLSGEQHGPSHLLTNVKRVRAYIIR